MGAFVSLMQVMLLPFRFATVGGSISFNGLCNRQFTASNRFGNFLTTYLTAQ